MKCPTLSIGLPVRNGMPFLKETLDYLLSQSFTDFELIISDNASDDGSWQCCQEAAQRDERISLFRRPENVGAAENVNGLFHQARGRYFKWATADDGYEPTYLERCVRVLDAHPDVALCYPKTWLVDEQGVSRTPYDDRLHLVEASPIERFGGFIRRVSQANAVLGVFRTESLAQTRLIGRFPSSDLVLLAEIALRGQIYEYPERLFLRRTHPGQSTRRYRNLRDRAAWFCPHRAKGRYFPRWRLFWEFERAVWRAPLPFKDRVACMLDAWQWIDHRREPHKRELREGLRRLIRGDNAKSERNLRRPAA